MNCEYIEAGRYTHPTIWINKFKPLTYYPYPSGIGTDGELMVALTRTQAIELRQELSKAIKEAVKARE